MSSSQATSAKGPAIAGLQKGDVTVAIAIMLATIAAELGVFLAGRYCEFGFKSVVMATLAVSAVWIALAGPVFGASGRDFFHCAMRAGLTADATLLTLLVVWLLGFWDEGGLSLLSILKLYCIYLAMAIAGGSVVACGRSIFQRYSIAACWAGFMLAMLATPFWSGGLIAASEGSLREQLTVVLVNANPFYSITAAVIDQMHYVIHQAPVLYHVTLLGDFVGVPEYTWYSAVIVYFAMAAIAGGVHLVISPNHQK